MSNEFNLMLSEDLSEVSAPILRLLNETGNCNSRGIAALLQLASCLMAEMAASVPSDEDHAVAAEAFKAIGSNHLAVVSVVAQMAKGFILVHHGYRGTNGPLHKES